MAETEREEFPQGLNVKFQEVVVHSVENWEADVAKQKLARRPNGLPPSCATHDSQSRATRQESFGGGVELELGRGRVQAQPAVGRQVGPPLPSGRCGGSVRSLFSPASLPA